MPFDEAANVAIMGRRGPGDPPDPPEQRVALDAIRNRALQLGAFMADRSEDLRRYQPGYGRWGIRDYAGNAGRNLRLIGGALAEGAMASAQDSINFYRDAGGVIAQASRWGMHQLASQLARQPQMQPLMPSGGPGPNPFRSDDRPEAYALADRATGWTESQAFTDALEERDPRRAHQLALDQYVQEQQEMLGDVLGSGQVLRPMLVFPQRILRRPEAESVEYVPRGSRGHRELAQFQANVEPAAQGAAGFVRDQVENIEGRRSSGRSGGRRSRS